MRFDILNQVSSAQAYTTSAAVSTDSIQKPAAQDISIGCPRMVFGCFVTAAAAGDVVATSYLFESIGADDAALTSNVVSLGSVTFLGSELVAGKEFEIPIKPYAADKAYLGTRVTTTGGTNPTLSLSSYLGEQGICASFKGFTKVVDAVVS